MTSHNAFEAQTCIVGHKAQFVGVVVTNKSNLASYHPEAGNLNGSNTEMWLGRRVAPRGFYTCQLSRIMRESHACGSKISISRVQANISRLTDKCEFVAHKPIKWKFNIQFWRKILQQMSVFTYSVTRTWILETNPCYGQVRKSAKIFRNIWKPSKNFGHLRKPSENLR